VKRVQSVAELGIVDATLRADAPPPDSILVIKPSSLGDVVHTLPAVALVKRYYPQAQIRWLVNPEWAPVLDGNPDVDEVVIFPREQFRGLRGFARAPGWATQLRASASSELVLDFQGLLRSALLGRICRRRALLGLSDAREGARFFYDRAIDVNHSMHAVERYLKLVSAVVVASEEPLSWKLPRGVAPQGFDAHLPFVLLHPFARGAGKSLEDAAVKRFCEALGPARVVIAGRRAEALPPIDNVVDLLNQTSLLQLIWLIRHAQCVVSVDSGPMHIASALTPRLIAIHTWSDPKKVGPFRAEATIWQQGTLRSVDDLRNGRPGREAAEIESVARSVASDLATVRVPP
jgi:ADP-heptose:LPS heptosyltransferase